jgi:hypothetical protein
MPDRPTLPEPTGDQGDARFRADLAAYLNSLFLHELGDLLGELPEPTRVALMQELSERGPAWARLPEDWPQLPGAACASSCPTAVPPGGGPHLSSCAAGGPRPTGRPSSSAVSAGPARWPSAGWPRPCGPGRPAATWSTAIISGRSRWRGRRGHPTDQARSAVTAATTPDPEVDHPGALAMRQGSCAVRSPMESCWPA